uniref:Peptidase S1 domain-containing protein n=1 Tax=Leptobrachium leishanense TaxID=445787 RepID=A0A8C5Q757_9ANUR
CGVPVISSRIVGGMDSVDGEWPWQVSILYRGSHSCGGSLISNQWILSAAHCFASKYDIYLGGYWETGGNTHLQSFNVEKLILDPQYVSVTSKGDIALVKLSSPVTFTDYVQPICLPSASVTFPSGMECWVTGWGDIAFAVSLPNPKTLQEVKIRLIDYKECDQLYNIGPSVDTAVNIQKEMICAGYKEGGKASCQVGRLGGGPVVCKVNGAWIQAGIVSFAQGCHSPQGAQSASNRSTECSHKPPNAAANLLNAADDPLTYKVL